MAAGPIRVMHVTSRLNVGGLAQQVLALCGGMNDGGFECELVTGQIGESEGDMLDFLPAPERLHRIPELGRDVRPFSDLVAFQKLLRHLREKRPHIVHTHAAKAGALGRIAALVAGVPVRIHSYHGHVFQGYFSPAVSRVIVGMERLLGLGTTAVVLPSESQRRDIVDKFRIVPEGKGRVVRYGIPVEMFASLPSKEEARRRLGISEEAIVVSAIGRMAAVKNHHLLVEAVSRISTPIQGRPVELLLVGDGECRPAIEAHIREKGLLPRVHLHPWIEDIRWVYAALDVLALTSKNEGVPIALLEAMAAGAPVISTAVGGVVDLISEEKNGLLVYSQEPGAFAEKLERMLRDEVLRERLAGQARQDVRAGYTEESFVESMKALYRSLVNIGPTLTASSV